MLERKRINIFNKTPTLLALSDYLQTPYSNCWSMNEFAVGGEIVSGPEGEIGDSDDGEPSDSSTVGSEPDLAGNKGLDVLMLELLVDTASND